MKILLITALLLLTSNLFAQDFVATLTKEDSLLIAQLVRYKQAVKFLSKNEALIWKDFNAIGEIRTADRNRVDSLATMNARYVKLQKLFSDSLLLSAGPAISLVSGKGAKLFSFNVRRTTALRFNNDVSALCMLQYSPAGVADKSNWWDGNEAKRFRIDEHWSYVIKVN